MKESISGRLSQGRPRHEVGEYIVNSPSSVCCVFMGIVTCGQSPRGGDFIAKIWQPCFFTSINRGNMFLLVTDICLIQTGKVSRFPARFQDSRIELVIQRAH